MNRRPGFRNFGRGVRRGRSKSGFFGWVALLVVVSLLGPMLVAVDVAPVWNVPTSPENSVGGTGSSGTAAEPAEVNFDVGVERTEEDAEVAAGGLVPAALAHAHTQPGGGCTYGRWSSGRCKACPSGQVWRTGRGCVSTTTTTNAPTTTTTASRSCPAGQTYYSSYGGCRPSSCANGRTSTGYCRACADPTHLRSGGRCVPKTRPSPGDPSCPSGQLYYGGYGGCRPANCSVGRTSSGYCRSCPSGQSYYSSYDGCRPSSCSNGRSSTGYCRACVDPTHQKVGGRCVPKTRPSPGDPSCPSGQLYYGSYGGCRPRSCPGGRTGSGYCRAVSPPTPRPSPPTGTTTTTSTTSTTTTTTTTTSTTVVSTTISVATTTTTTIRGITTTGCSNDAGSQVPSVTTTVPATTVTTQRGNAFPSTYYTISSSTITWEEAIGVRITTTTTPTSTTTPRPVPTAILNQGSSSKDDSSTCPTTNPGNSRAGCMYGSLLGSQRCRGAPASLPNAPTPGSVPLYYDMVCTTYSANQNTNYYLNMSKNNSGNCPVMGMLLAIRDYKPEWGYTESIYDDYGLVAVKNTSDSECSYLTDVERITNRFRKLKNALLYDFQIPCKSHDYCSDLQRAGFSITDQDCDDQFYLLMQADCNNRQDSFLQDSCFKRAQKIYSTVRWPMFDVSVSPGMIKLQNSATRLCVTVNSNNSRIVQLMPCNDSDKQQFRIYPSGDNVGTVSYIVRHRPHGKFVDRGEGDGTVMWQQADTCIEVKDLFPVQNYATPRQVILNTSCDHPNSSQKMIISSPLNEDKYSFSSLSDSDFCWKAKSIDRGAGIISANCINGGLSSIFQWRIRK